MRVGHNFITHCFIRGHVVLVKTLLKLEPVNTVNKWGNTPISDVCYQHVPPMLPEKTKKFCIYK